MTGGVGSYPASYFLVASAMFAICPHNVIRSNGIICNPQHSQIAVIEDVYTGRRNISSKQSPRTLTKMQDLPFLA